MGIVGFLAAVFVAGSGLIVRRFKKHKHGFLTIPPVTTFGFRNMGNLLALGIKSAVGMNNENAIGVRHEIKTRVALKVSPKFRAYFRRWRIFRLFGSKGCETQSDMLVWLSNTTGTDQVQILEVYVRRLPCSQPAKTKAPAAMSNMSPKSIIMVLLSFQVIFSRVDKWTTWIRFL